MKQEAEQIQKHDFEVFEKKYWSLAMYHNRKISLWSQKQVKIVLVSAKDFSPDLRGLGTSFFLLKSQSSFEMFHPHNPKNCVIFMLLIMYHYVPVPNFNPKKGCDVGHDLFLPHRPPQLTRNLLYNML